MRVRIGYACKTLGVPQTNQKSCFIKNAQDKLLLKITQHNLDVLEAMIDYNIKSNIMLFRISSGLIPFGSSPVNKTHWEDMYKEKLLGIGNKIKNSGMRVSMHPGQYTVLNSTDEDVVKRAVEDLTYHTSVLDSFKIDEQNKIILHIGGIYGDKKQAVYRFSENYKRLDENIKRRLVIENDDKNYSIGDVLQIGEKLSIPVVFDNLHNKVNPCCKEVPDMEWIEACSKTWRKKDGPQKIHYSQQDLFKKPGAHSKSIRIVDFIKFYDKIKNKKIDIMLEVKDKNLSALKCINCIIKQESNDKIKLEWEKYKYKVHENSPENFNQICKLLKTKTIINPIIFYKLIENSFMKYNTLENSVNTAIYIWKYFENLADESENATFFRKIKDYKKGKNSLIAIKRYLWKISVKYDQESLLNSYYFIL